MSVNVLLSYLGIRLVTSVFPVGLFAAKALSETLLFLANFLVQRDLIFTRRQAGLKPVSMPRSRRGAFAWTRSRLKVTPGSRLKVTPG